MIFKILHKFFKIKLSILVGIPSFKDFLLGENVTFDFMKYSNSQANNSIAQLKFKKYHIGHIESEVRKTQTSPHTSELGFVTRIQQVLSSFIIKITEKLHSNMAVVLF